MRFYEGKSSFRNYVWDCIAKSCLYEYIKGEKIFRITLMNLFLSLKEKKEGQFMQLVLNGKGLCADTYCFVNLLLVNSLCIEKPLTRCSKSFSCKPGKKINRVEVPWVYTTTNINHASLCHLLYIQDLIVTTIYHPFLLQKKEKTH